ncbi:MAG: metal ABC transporter ATP-binding protein [Chloroflexota bacterium]
MAVAVPTPSTTQMTETLALDVHRLATGYAGDRRVIDEVTFSVNSGERVAIIGPNGAGKSTLFKAIVGLIPFTMGHISIFGEDCRSSHNHVGYVPQYNDIDWSFPVSVYDVVMMGRTRHMGWFRWARKKDHEMVQRILKQLSLTAFADRQIGELSGGQKQRVFIARALAQETRVLLMDEPFTGVDGAAEQEIISTLDVLTEQGITMLVATHDMEKAANDFDKVMLMRGGILGYGTPDEVLQPDILRQAYGGSVRVFSQGDTNFMIMDE